MSSAMSDMVDPAGAAAAEAAAAAAAALAADPVAAAAAVAAEAAAAAAALAADPPPDLSGVKLVEGLSAEHPSYTAFVAAAGDLRLTAEQAQTLVDKVAPAFKAALQAPFDFWATQTAAWDVARKADPVVGGVNYEASKVHVAKALDHFGGQSLREEIALTGAGNGPALFKAFALIGKAMSEGGFVTGRTAGAAEKTLGQRMYPTMETP
jgi:hypothetical protein